MRQQNIPLPRLLDLIERYFDCSLSDSEENELREILATSTLSHPSIDEARALMGFRHTVADPVILPAKPHVKKRFDFRPIIGIAAAVAIIILIGLHLHTSPSGSDNSVCIAYVNGQRITDEADIMKLLSEDMLAFEKAAEESQRDFEEELNAFAPALDEFETSTNE